MAREWVQSKTDRRPNYTETLHGRLEKYLLPRFGPLYLDQVSVSGIEMLRDDMRKLGRSPVTINGVIRMIGGSSRWPCAEDCAPSIQWTGSSTPTRANGN